MIQRFDSVRLDGKMEKTPEGYLRGDAVVTRTGVFQYTGTDGMPIFELRHPEDVFKPDSMESMKMIPVTLEHPDEFVNADNAKRLSVGSTGENVQADGRNVRATLTITDENAIKAIEGGKRELSLGYSVDLVPVKGNYDGVEYDFRQTNMRYNHLAIVDRARAGAEARLNIDGQKVEKTQTKETSMSKIKLKNGISYDAADEVAVEFEEKQTAIDSLKSDVAEAKKNLDTVTGERDGLKEKIAELEKENESLKNADHSEEIRERVALEKTAEKHLDSDVEIAKLSNVEIKKAIVAKVSKADLAEKSDEYVEAFFQSAIETLSKEDKSPADEQRESINNNDENETLEVLTSEGARNSVLDSLI